MFYWLAESSFHRLWFRQYWDRPLHLTPGIHLQLHTKPDIALGSLLGEYDIVLNTDFHLYWAVRSSWHLSGTIVIFLVASCFDIMTSPQECLDCTSAWYWRIDFYSYLWNVFMIWNEIVNQPKVEYFPSADSTSSLSCDKLSFWFVPSSDSHSMFVFCFVVFLYWK